MSMSFLDFNVAEYYTPDDWINYEEAEAGDEENLVKIFLVLIATGSLHVIFFIFVGPLHHFVPVS